MSYRYEVKDNHLVVIFKDSEEFPVLLMSTWPNFKPFETKEDAEGWAEMHIESLENPEAPYAPIGPGEERVAKPTL